MVTNFDHYARLEPRPYEFDLQAGFSAAIQDPVWFLGRQWQMGEHQGENASSPVWVTYALSSRQIRSSDPRFDPIVIPAEAIVESELDDWWTMGRRVRIGTRVGALVDLPDDDSLRFYNPPPPYEFFHDRFDGLALWRRRIALGIPAATFGADVPPDSIPAWDREQLLYQQIDENAFAAAQYKLTVHRHRGGRLDWYSVDGARDQQAPVAAEEPAEIDALPTALQYPGAPNNRWWQIEDAEVDLGGYAPDTAHSPTALLTELIFSHSDDWFLLPVSARAGNVVAIESLRVLDGFGREYDSEDTDDAGERRWPGLRPPSDWTLFQVDGLRPEELVLWHVAELPLEGNPLEKVQFGLDEESNLLWAVERTVDGREVESRKVVPPAADAPPKFNPGKPSGDARKREYAYVAGQGIVPFWHPYVIDEVDGNGGQATTRRLVQRRLADLSRQKPILMPPPAAQVLQPDPLGAQHQVAPLAIPSNGIEIERRWQLARDMNGAPVLWIQRQRRTLLAPPARRLRFDVMEPANQE